MNSFNGSAIFFEHPMLELLGRVVVEGCVKRGRVDLVQQSIECFDIRLGFFIQRLLIAILCYSDSEESVQDASEDTTPWQHG